MKLRDARARALRTGGSLEFEDGTRFNAAGLVAAVRSRAETPGEAKSGAESPVTSGLEERVIGLANDMRLLAGLLLHTLDARSNPPEPPDETSRERTPVSWEFRVERDDQGFIRTVTATPRKP